MSLFSRAPTTSMHASWSTSDGSSPPLEPAVEREPDHPLEPRAMARKEFQKRGLVPVLYPVLQLDQSAGFA
jgi:hypothetical protein